MDHIGLTILAQLKNETKVPLAYTAIKSGTFAHPPARLHASDRERRMPIDRAELA